jgi:hypothetical protein
MPGFGELQAAECEALMLADRKGGQCTKRAMRMGVLLH